MAPDTVPATKSGVSVVIPCYNHARYLSQAIDSVLAQTRAVAEILVVDDGSSDDTPAVAARYGARVHYIRQENRGLSAARNTGVRCSAGGLLAFLDADDLWTPDFVATLAPILEADPAAGAAYGGCQFIDEDGTPLPQQTLRTVPPERLHDTLVEGDIFPAHAVLTRRQCFDAVGLFDENLRSNEDWDMWLRISALCPMIGVPRIVALYRMHGDNMSRNLERMHETQVAVAQKHFGPAVGDPATWPPDRRRAFAAGYLARAAAHYRRGEPAAGQEYIVRALRAAPLACDRLDVFYGLGCANQPLGRMGDLSQVALEENAAWLLSALQRTFAEPGLAPELAARRRSIFGTAYCALGLLAYGSGRTPLARRWLLAAARQRPGLCLQRQWGTTLAKSLLGFVSRAALNAQNEVASPPDLKDGMNTTRPPLIQRAVRRVSYHTIKTMEALAYRGWLPQPWEIKIRDLFWEDQARLIHAQWGRGDWDFPVLEGIIREHHLDSVLDVGCGSGRLFPLYKACGVKKVLGVDISKEALAIAARDYPDVPTIECAIEALRLPSGSYQLIVSNRVLQHIPARHIAAVVDRLCQIGEIIYLNELSDSDGLAEEFYMTRHDYPGLFAACGWQLLERGRIGKQTYLLMGNCAQGQPA